MIPISVFVYGLTTCARAIRARVIRVAVRVQPAALTGHCLLVWTINALFELSRSSAPMLTRFPLVHIPQVPSPSLSH